MLKHLVVPWRDPGTDNLLWAEQDMARPMGQDQRDVGGKVEPPPCPALGLWSYHSTGQPGHSPEGPGAPVAQGIPSAWHSTSQKQDKSG